jgi:2-dehydro-3-deoxygalactonokinase
MTWALWGDWGTTRLRLFRVAEGNIVDRADGPGIGQLSVSPQHALSSLLEQWESHGHPERIVLSGMAGSRTGLCEAPYLPCPVTLAEWTAATAVTDLWGIPVHIGAGVRLESQDVMRGEEAQIFGALALNPHLARGGQCFVLPGTHSKWVQVSNGTIRSLRTYPTGELFGLLRQHSTLFQTASEGRSDAAAENEGWEEGLDVAKRADQFLGSLFRARTAQLLERRSPDWAAGFLSGLLIGNEVGEAHRSGSAAADTYVIGETKLAARYRAALAAFGQTVASLDSEACTLAGLEVLDVACR